MYVFLFSMLRMLTHILLSLKAVYA